MVHPVVEVETELQLLALSDIKVLEQAHIPIEIGRSVNGRENRWAILTDLRRCGQAIRVNELMRFQSTCWIAR